MHGLSRQRKKKISEFYPSLAHFNLLEFSTPSERTIPLHRQFLSPANNNEIFTCPPLLESLLSCPGVVVYFFRSVDLAQTRRVPDEAANDRQNPSPILSPVLSLDPIKSADALVLFPTHRY